MSAGSDEEEVPLVGGRSTAGVVRVGDTVHRPTGPWTPVVHDFLRHLHARGFEGAPEPLGFDEQGREILTFIEGEVLGTPQDPAGPLILVAWPEAWRSDDALEAAGRLLRRLHEASRGFTTEHTDWRLFDRAMRPGEILCHADHGPWNAVYADGRPVALIDWDSARPDEPLFDLASAAWHFVPLLAEEEAATLGFSDLSYGRRLRLFLDAYGLADRSRFIEALQWSLLRQSEHPRYWGLGPEETASFVADLVAELRWLGAHEQDLRRWL